MSGLTLGLLSFDGMTLEILSTTGTKSEKAKATKIHRLVRHHHWLLCTLLLMNALAMEALPIFLDQLVPSALAIILSVTLILMFGEVIPQALCSRFGLTIGWASYYLVLVLMIISAPITWPLSKLLDCILGKQHGTFFRRAQLKELVTLHGKEKRDELEETGSAAPLAEGPLTVDEITVIRGALDLSEKVVGQIMTRLSNAYMLPLETKLDLEAMKDLLRAGHSRIPIYRNQNRQDLCGVLIVKRLITLNPGDAVPISSLRLRSLPAVRDDYNVWALLNKFQEGKSHIAAVFSLLDKDESSEVVDLQQPDASGESGDLQQQQQDGEEVGVEDDDQGVDLNPTTKKGKRKGGKKQAPIVRDVIRSFSSSFSQRKSMDVRDIGARRGIIVGLVTLEDVLEELIQEEIVDETDVYVDLNTHLRVAEAYRRMSIAARRSEIFADRSYNIAGVHGAGPDAEAMSDVVVHVPRRINGDPIPAGATFMLPEIPISSTKKRKRKRRSKKKKTLETDTDEATPAAAGGDDLAPESDAVEMSDMKTSLIDDE